MTAWILLAALAAGGQDKPGKGVPSPSEDRSLSAEVFLDRGMPAPDRSWTPPDYVKAVEVLRKTAAENALFLPRRGSPASGALFDRLASLDNFATAANSTLSLDDRASLVIGFSQSLPQILMIYLEAQNKEGGFDAELTSFMILMLRNARVGMEWAREFLPTIRLDDPRREARLNGFKRMKGGFADVVLGSLQTLTERETFRPSELVRLVEALKIDLPILFGELPEEAQKEVRIKVRDLSAKESEDSLKGPLKSLEAALPAEK